MKVNRIISLFLAIILCCSALIISAHAVDPGIQGQSCISLDAGKSLAGSEQLLETAKAAVLYCIDSDTMVYSWNPDERLDPSGMNKILTALLAIELGNLDDQVTVTRSALSSVEEGAVSAGLKDGEVLTLRDLLYCMMVGSANDAAAVIAEHISGGQPRFLLEMNKYAKKLGCTNTSFLNPSGLSQEGQYTSARDLAKITAEAIKHEEFMELFSATEYIVPATEKSDERKLITTNYMISDVVNQDYYDLRITGGKTGALDTNDRSFVSTAEDEGLHYLAVVMSAGKEKTTGEKDKSKYLNFRETAVLLDYGFDNYSMCQLLDADVVMDQFQVADGENNLAVTSAETIVSLMPNEMFREQLSYRCIPAADLSAPVNEGDVVGSIQLWYDDLCVAQCDLSAMFDVKKAGTDNIPIQPTAKQNNGIWKTLLTVLIVVVISITVIVFVVLISMRIINTRKGRRRKLKRTARRGR